MKRVPGNQFLYEREGVFWFRRAVPATQWIVDHLAATNGWTAPDGGSERQRPVCVEE